MCKRVSEWNEFWLPIFNFEPVTSSSHVQKNVGMEFEQLVLASYARQSFIWNSTWCCTCSGGMNTAPSSPSMLTWTAESHSIWWQYQWCISTCFSCHFWFGLLLVLLNSFNLLDLTPWLDTGPSNLILPFYSLTHDWLWVKISTSSNMNIQCTIESESSCPFKPFIVPIHYIPM